MRTRRGSTWALLVVGGLVAALVVEAAHLIARGGDRERLAQAQAVARGVGLTDLALFTEARYARHLSQADLASAFQDGPMSFEHFPVGSLTPPARDFPGGLVSATEPAPQEAPR